jgi:hypothetical protein
MHEARLERWQELHVRSCQGISLTTEEQLEYDSGCRELDEEEMAQLQVTGLQEELDRMAMLEREHERLMAEKRRLDIEIASRISALSDRTKKKLKVGA